MLSFLPPTLRGVIAFALLVGKHAVLVQLLFAGRW